MSNDLKNTNGAISSKKTQEILEKTGLKPNPELIEKATIPDLKSGMSNLIEMAENANDELKSKPILEVYYHNILMDRFAYVLKNKMDSQQLSQSLAELDSLLNSFNLTPKV